MVSRTRGPVLATGTATAATLPSSPAAGQLVRHESSGTVYTYNGATWEPVDSSRRRGPKAADVSAGHAVTLVGGVYQKTDVSTHDRADGVVKAVVEGEAEVWSAGSIDGFSGLTPGSRAFVSSTPGVLSSTVPASGVEIPVGFCETATILAIRLMETVNVQ